MADDTTTWVPICCQSVMRHNSFQGPNNALAATLVCASCGKHLLLQPSSGALDEYGEGARVLHVLGVSRPARRNAESSAAPAPPSENTL
jgi:hypothetical protein